MRPERGQGSRPTQADHERRGRAIVERLTHEAALRGEKLVCVCRVVFCTLVLARLWIEHLPVPLIATVLKVGVSGSAMAFSGFMWVAIRRDLCTRRLLFVSVLADAAMCGTCLAGTTLWPGTPDYGGLLTRVEPIAILIMVFTSGFRFSTTLAGLGGVANGVATAALLVLDRARAVAPLRYGGTEIFFFAMGVTSAAVLAVATAIITRRLVEAVAREAMRVEGVRHELTDILRDQHDAKSLLSTASLNVDLVRRNLGPAVGSSADGSRTAIVFDDLRRTLDILGSAVVQLGDRASGQLALLREVAEVDSALVIPAAISALRARFAEVTILSRLDDLPRVSILGGRGGLERALFNLVRNAVQGDGTVGAHHIWIATCASAQQLRLSVRDDGPGFPVGIVAGRDADAAHPTDTRLSPKPDGWGFGLFGLNELAAASGGRLDLGNAPQGGAEVTLTLPALSERTSKRSPRGGEPPPPRFGHGPAA